MAKPYTAKQKLKHTAIRFLMTAMRVFPVNRNKIVITNYYGKGYGDNGKAIAESLRKLDPALDIVWGVNDDYRASIPETVRPVRYNSIRFLWELSTAGAWVDNCRKNPGITKRRQQFYVQTWHGATPLKRIEGDVEAHLDEFYVAGAKNDSKMADLMLSGCRFFTEICRRAFWYDGEILECGSPRLDTLFHTDPDKQRQVKAALGIPEGKKVALYAPTFRADGQLKCYDMDFCAVLDTLEKKTGEKWVFAIRLHPNVAHKADFITYSDALLNATDYPDLYELLPCADLVISDYSSIMFEAGLIHKPVMLFANDIDEYTADRNFYLDITKLPFPLSQNNEELLSCLESFDEARYLQALKAFNADMGYSENGTAADTAAERILKEINGRK